PKYKPIRSAIERGRFHEIRNMLGEFLRQVSERGYEGADPRLIRPLLSDDLPLDIRRRLEDIYLSLRSRIGSDRVEDWVACLLTKPPSPSRVSRIWKETLHFIEKLANEAQDIVRESVDGYCLRIRIEPEFMDPRAKEFFEDKRNRHQLYEVIELGFDIHLPKMDIYWDGEYFNTTLRIENYVTVPKGALQQVLTEKREKIEKASRRLVSSTFKIKAEDKVFEIRVRNVKLERYLPFRKIIVSPNRFEILVPANLALKIANRFLNMYNKEFSKVRGRLSFNIGIIFFKRKFPLFAVIDSVERSIESLLVLLGKDGWRKFKVENVKLLDGLEIEVTELDNGVEKEISDHFGSWIKAYKWHIHRKLGDGEDDFYHPNFIVENAAEDEKTYFEVPLEEGIVSMLNVQDLKSGKIVKVMPNLFDFQFLDSTTRRFDLAMPRKHELFREAGPRPYLLEDLEKMILLWKILKEKLTGKKLTRTQIRKLEHMCTSKIKEWISDGKKPAEDHMFRKFVSSCVENVCEGLNSDEVNILASSILSGMFFDIVELFMKLESKVGGENNEKAV
ncbi:hypothetical protein DRP04_09620, partial [Archaeoglobales archaeon]